MRRAGLLLVVVLCGMLTGCGIRPTGVVDAGEPARGPVPEITANPGDTGDAAQTAPPGVNVYFVIGDTVRAVFRPGLPPGNPDIALKVLLQGPTPDELKSGYGTDLPREVGVIQLGRRNVDAVTVIMDLDPNQLSSLAILQITCTISYTVPANSLITLSSPNGESFDTKPCPELNQDAQEPEPESSPRVGG